MSVATRLVGVNPDMSTSTALATTTPVPNPITSGSSTKSTQPTQNEIWDHYIHVILDLDQEEKDLFKNGGIRKMGFFTDMGRTLRISIEYSLTIFQTLSRFVSY